MTTKKYTGKPLRNTLAAVLLLSAATAMAQLPALPALPETNPAEATPAAATPDAAIPVTPLAATPLPATPGAPEMATDPLAQPPAVPGATPASFTPQPGGPGYATPVMPATAAPSSDMRQQAFDPVRQAIAARNFTAAAQALQNVRQQFPNDPAIVTFESAIRNGLAQGQAGAPPLIRTPAAGVTPLPQVQPTPEPTPAATPAPAEAPEDDSSAAVSSDTGIPASMKDQPAIMYGAAAVLALAIIGGLIYFFRRKRATPPAAPSIYDDETPPPGSLPAVSPDQLDFSAGLDPLAPPAPADLSAPDFSPAPASAEFPTADFTAFPDTSAGAGATGFTSFGLDEDEEDEEAHRPAMPQRPAPAPDADVPLNLFGDDEPTVAMPAPPASPASEDVSLDFSDETVQLPAAPPPPPSRTAPEYTEGPVNLDDIFGAPSSAPADDASDHTMPTFVSTPHVDPEENVEIPNQNMRPEPAADSDVSISFDQLFGNTGSAPKAPPPPPPPQPASDMSIEDALAATLGAMQAQNPDDAPAPAAPQLDEAPASDNLDERTERMFADQMEKARAAMAEQDWRQAIHVLSIASALHPENDEARQMLRQAREERRKAEEGA